MTDMLALTSLDPEPPIWSMIEAGGRLWMRVPQTWQRGATYWVLSDDLDGEPESWAKLAGNYGPALVVRWGLQAGHLDLRQFESDAT